MSRKLPIIVAKAVELQSIVTRYSMREIEAAAWVMLDMGVLPTFVVRFLPRICENADQLVFPLDATARTTGRAILETKLHKATAAMIGKGAAG